VHLLHLIACFIIFHDDTTRDMTGKGKEHSISIRLINNRDVFTKERIREKREGGDCFPMMLAAATDGFYASIMRVLRRHCSKSASAHYR
jgi:hypothetical protein